MSAQMKHILTAVALGGFMAVASAQQMAPLAELKLAHPIEQSPYVIDSQRIVVRSGTGLCWRTGFWTPELAAKTMVVGSDKPVGCYCDEGALPKAVCTPPPQPPVVVAPPAPPAPPPPVLRSEKITISADTLFAFDRSVLSEQGKATLNDFLGKLKGLNLEAIVAIGHTDRIGTNDYNARLSEQRARTVKDYLVTQGGIAADRVFVEGRGESQPVTKVCTTMGKEVGSNAKLVSCLQPDRRVDIEAVGSR
jgi:OOP family OmpA-OmpF porin